MKALWRITFIPVLLAVVLFSCEKDRHERGCADQVFSQCSVDSNKTHIRIRNFTKFPLCDFYLYNSIKDSSESVFFGYLPVDSASCFMAVDQTILGAGIDFNVGAQHFKTDLLSNSIHKDTNSFVTYNIFLEQLTDTAADGSIYLYWQPSQIPVVDQY